MGKMDKPMVEQALLDEAVQLGSRGVAQANRAMVVNRYAIQAMVDALAYVESGRVAQARERLKAALVQITRLLA